MRYSAAVLTTCLSLLSSVPTVRAQTTSDSPVQGQSDVVKFEDFASDDSLAAAFEAVAEAVKAHRQVNLQAKELVEPALAAFRAEPTIANETTLAGANARAIQHQYAALDDKGHALNTLLSAVTRYRQRLAGETDEYDAQVDEVDQAHDEAVHKQSTAADNIREVLPLLFSIVADGETDDVDPSLLSALLVIDVIAEWEGVIVKQTEGEIEQIRPDQARLSALIGDLERVEQEVVGQLGTISAQQRFLAHQAGMQLRYIKRRGAIAGSEQFLTQLDELLRDSESAGPPVLAALPATTSSSYTPRQRNNKDLLADLIRKYSPPHSTEEAAADLVAQRRADSEDDNE